MTTRKVIYPHQFFDRDQEIEITVTEHTLGYINLNGRLPADTITEPAECVGLSLSVTAEGHLFGSLLVQTNDGWHRFILGRDDWTDILSQAASFSEIFNDPAKLHATIEQLKSGQANEQ